MNSWSRVLLFLATLLLASSASYADSFGSGENAFTIDFVTIGAPGNPADTTGDPNPAGAVPYTYRIGKYEVPEDAVRKANTLGGLGITLDSRGPNKPATSLSWFEVAKFVNWLNTSTGATPAYKFDNAGTFQLWVPGDVGYNPNNVFRNNLARYYLPSVDEWYKAAFYDPTTGGYWDYPTGRDTPPNAIASGTMPGTAVWNQTDLVGPADVDNAGGLSPWLTMAQGGNVIEWQEGRLVSGNPTALPEFDLRGLRGDDWGLAIDGSGLSSLAGTERLASASGPPIGFRVASIPEPTTLMMAGLSALFCIVRAVIMGRSYEIRHCTRFLSFNC